ncbi:MAG: ERCC4 domain-containing protein [Candidatus Hecatellaceae archaeon]
MEGLRTLTVIADYREKASRVPELLEALGVKVLYRSLTIGDYIVSESHVVERKTARDFLSSLYSGRLFDQALRLAEAYPQPILIVEGNFHEVLKASERPRAALGALVSLSLKFEGKFHIFFAENEEQTAELIYIIARQLSAKPKYLGPVVKQRKKLGSLREAQLAVVSSLPGVGPKLAERLLKTFKTVRRVFQASVGELTFVEGLTPAKAEALARLLDTPYQAEAKQPRQEVLEEASGED